MAQVYQVPHHAFGWLLAGTLLAGLPHLWHGPLWLQLALPLAVGWRALVHRGQAGLPGRTLRLALLLGAVGGTFYTHGTLLGPEAGTCLLTAAFALKLLETFRLRDACIVVLLGYFVLATAFLFWQGILVSLFVVAVMMVLTASLVGMNHPRASGGAWPHLRLAAVMMFQAIPLMVVLFVLVPRIEPLWSLQMDEPEHRTGMTDSVSPGDIGELSQSDELAFRARFQGTPPDYRQRYWRGLTLSRFDGRTWSALSPREVDPAGHVWFSGEPRPHWLGELLQARGEPLFEYQVLLEPTGQPWLFALAVPFVGGEDRDIGIARDMRLVHRNDVKERVAYSVRSHPNALGAMPLHERERDLNLRLPGDHNARTRERAREWRGRTDSDREFVEQVLRWFHEEPFYYTLRPATLGEDNIDEFLFSSREGFCEHYASAFAFMMRAAGIPARLVAGYQGGEMNAVGNYMRVHQYDAHAWVEIWQEQAGWVQIDPTAAVAPERVEFGLERALEERGEQRAGGGMGRWRQYPGLSRLASMADYMQFVWQTWVLSYDQGDQLELFEQWFGGMSPWRVAMALGMTLGLIVLPLALWILLRRRGTPHGPLQKEYHRLLRWLRRQGVEPRAGETPRGLVARAAGELPAQASTLHAWGRAFEHLAYSGNDNDPENWEQLRRASRRLRFNTVLHARL